MIIACGLIRRNADKSDTGPPQPSVEVYHTDLNAHKLSHKRSMATENLTFWHSPDRSIGETHY